MKLTKVLLATTATLAVLLTVKFTSTTSTRSLEFTIVLFSLDVTLTTFVQLPTDKDLATIVNVLFLPLFKSKVQLTTFPVVTFPSVTSTNSKPRGNASLMFTPVASISPVLFTAIVKVTKVLFPTTCISADFTTVKFTGRTLTVSVSLKIVTFSSQVTLTSFVQLPIALVLATIVKVTFLPLSKTLTNHVTL